MLADNFRPTTLATNACLMRYQPILFSSLVITLSAILCGCSAGKHGCNGYCDGYQFYQPACHGYTSTCWHPWPQDCENCPPPYEQPHHYAPAAENVETVPLPAPVYDRNEIPNLTPPPAEEPQVPQSSIKRTRSRIPPVEVSQTSHWDDTTRRL